VSVDPGQYAVKRMSNAAPLRVFLAGRVKVEADGVVLEDGRLATRQGRLVFAYLVAERGRPVPTDELAEALWGSAPPPTWDKALTVIASKLRGALTDAGVEGGAALTSAFGCYRLDLPEGSWVDVIVAADAADAAEHALAVGQLEAARAAAAPAVDLLRQPFVPGEDGVWVEAKRRELADVQGRALNVLAAASLRLGDASEAVRWAEQAVALEPFREAGYRRLMEAHAAAGNRAEALQVYERCRLLLAEELGAYPSPETDSIYRQLLVAPAPEDRASVVPPGEGPEPSTQVVAEGPPASSPPQRRATRERSPAVRRRTVLIAALAGVLAAAVAVLLFAFSSGGSPTQLDGDAVGAVSGSTGHIFAAIPLSASPDAIAAGAGSIWVAMSDRGAVSRIDPATNTMRQTITTPGGPSALAVGGGFVWVADALAGTVAQIDPRTNGGQVVGKPIHVGNGPSGIAYGLRAVWVANSVDRTVIRIDPVTGTPGPPISVEGGADGVAAGDGSVWVIGQSAGVLSRIDPVARTVAGTTSVGNEPAAVAVGPDAVWVANGADGTGTVSKIDPSGHLEGAFAVGKQPSGIAVAADGHVWVANAGSATLTELDPATGHKIRTVPTGAPPGGVALYGETAYVAARTPPSAHRGGTLTLAIANPPGQYAQPIPLELDPASGYSAWELLAQTNDGLLTYSRAGGAESYKVVPDLATGPPTISNGGLTYTFQLRKGIRYSTGGVVQPADIRRGIERALLESAGQTPGGYLAVIRGGSDCLRGKHCDLSSGVETSLGSSTVTFHLSKPDPDFLFKLALPDYDAVPASTPLHARLPLPATGPYKIAGYQKKGVVVLVRNPRFHVWSTEAQPNGYPDKIVERYRYTGAQAIHAVERGEADVTTDGLDQTWPPALAASLHMRHLSQLYPEPTLYHIGVWLNTRLAPFDDVRVRRAFNLAVDRDRLAQITGGAVACQYLPPNVNGYSLYCPYNGPNLGKARRLVAESGTMGQPVTIWMYDVPVLHRNGAYLVSVLGSIGYKARAEFVPYGGPTWRPDRQAGVGGSYWIADYPSANDVLVSFLCSSYTTDPATNQNPAGICDRRLDAQVARARSLETTNPAAATGAWHKADRMLTDDAPFVPMKLTLSTDFVGRRVGNYKYCWLSGSSGLIGACLDQLWVR
jgi:ABC-type transport system substrate-binding protein/DNA-binding SARP family transcriptional activator